MPTRNSDHPFADVPAGPDLATLEQDKQALEGYLAALVVAEQEYADGNGDERSVQFFHSRTPANQPGR